MSKPFKPWPADICKIAILLAGQGRTLDEIEYVACRLSADGLTAFDPQDAHKLAQWASRKAGEASPAPQPKHRRTAQPRTEALPEGVVSLQAYRERREAAKRAGLTVQCV